MANIKIYNSRPMHFASDLTASEILSFQFFIFQKYKVMEHILQWRHSKANAQIYKCRFFTFFIVAKV